MVFRVSDNLSIVTPAKAEGRRETQATEHRSREGNQKMNFKYACIAATLAFIAPASAALAADGDAAAGEALFKQKCKVCHQIGEGAKNFVGPELNGIIGRKTGSAAGYSYSDANKNSGITWDAEKLNTYLTDPKATIPGTKMIFAGLPKDTDRANIIAYVSSFDADGKKK